MTAVIHGTPVDQDAIERIRDSHRRALQVKRENRRDRSIPLVSPPRPLARPEMPQPMGKLLMLAGQHGWRVLEPPTIHETVAVYAICKLIRRDLGAVACWERKGGEWRFDDGWTVAGDRIKRVTSKQLREWIVLDEECPVCHRSSANHDGECAG